MVESLVLSALGGGAGVMLALGSLGWIRSLSLPRAADIATDWRVLYDETIPTSGVIAEAMDGYRARLTAPVAAAFRELDGSARPGGLGAGDRQSGRTLPSSHAAAQAEALAHGQLAAAEAMSRWWLATGGLPASELAELLIDTLEPGLAQRATNQGAS